MASALYSLQLPATPHCSIKSAYSFPSMDPFFSVFLNVVLSLLWHHKEFPGCPQVPGVKPIYSRWDTYLLFCSPRREIPTSVTQRMALADAQIIHLTFSISCSVNSFPSSVLTIPPAFTVIFCFVLAMKSESCQSYSSFHQWKSRCLSELTFTSQPWRSVSTMQNSFYKVLLTLTQGLKMELLQHNFKYHHMHSTLVYKKKSTAKNAKLLYNVAFTLMDRYQQRISQRPLKSSVVVAAFHYYLGRLQSNQRQKVSSRSCF